MKSKKIVIMMTLLILLNQFAPMVYAGKKSPKIGLKTQGEITVNGNVFPASFNLVIGMKQTDETTWEGRGDGYFKVDFPQRSVKIPLKVDDLKYNSETGEVTGGSRSTMIGDYHLTVLENGVLLSLDVLLETRKGVVFDIQYSVIGLPIVIGGGTLSVGGLSSSTGGTMTISSGS